MMVQDIFETEYYAGAVISKTFDINKPLDKQIMVNKYWPVDGATEYDEEKYEVVLMEREVYHMVGVKGEGDWVRKWRGDKGMVKQVVMRVYQGEGLKLGQVVTAVAIVDFPKKGIEAEDYAEPGTALYHYPEATVPRLNMIRVLTAA